MTSNRWIKLPGPGAFRGEGTWTPFEGDDDQWEYFRGTGYLPTREGPKPEDKP